MGRKQKRRHSVHSTTDDVHRVALFDTITYLDHTSSRNSADTEKLLRNYRGNVILISGGNDRRNSFHSLAKEISHRCRAVILFDGTATRQLLSHLINVPVVIVPSMKNAVRLATALAETDDTILLSPSIGSNTPRDRLGIQSGLFRKYVAELRR